MHSWVGRCILPLIGALQVADIFVSYRKQGADKEIALHLAEDLRAALGEASVFLDDQAYALGRFSDLLTDELHGCRAVAVVIGHVWMERRLDLWDPGDWVRREIETGLRRKSLMVPVLVDDAKFPQASDLPPLLAGLLDYQAVPIYRRHWKENVDALIAELAKRLGLRRTWSGGAVPNLSGDWVDTDGVQLKLVHRGSDVKIYLLSGGRPVGEGDATIAGNEVRFSIWRPDLGHGKGVGTVSPDGRQVSGAVQYGSQRFGFSIWRR